MFFSLLVVIAWVRCAVIVGFVSLAESVSRVLVVMLVLWVYHHGLVQRHKILS